jgi:cytochrome oxidase Cu insertion factor (SCO1/SenC/PrrC family)
VANVADCLGVSAILSKSCVGATVHIPNPGDSVPDFTLINQNGKRISLHQYRGQTLLLTPIYARCPFPDFARASAMSSAR